MFNNRLYIGSSTGIVTEISIKNKKIKNNYPIPLENGICTMLPIPERNSFFIGDNIGNMIEWSLENQKLDKYFGRAHSSKIDFMTLSNDQKYLITKDVENCVKYWHLETQAFVKNVGYPSDDNIIALISIMK